VKIRFLIIFLFVSIGFLKAETIKENDIIVDYDKFENGLQCTVYVDGIDEYYLEMMFLQDYNGQNFNIMCVQHDDEGNVVNSFTRMQGNITVPHGTTIAYHIKSLMVEELRELLKEIDFLNIRSRNNIQKIIVRIIDQI
jgi:hypothetical protein